MSYRRRTWLAVPALCLVAIGCESPGDQVDKDPAPPKPPAGYHRAEPTPIDAALRADAAQHLVAALRSPDELVRAHALESLADIGQPAAGQPAAGQPAAGQPAAGQPDAGLPDAAALVVPLLTDPSLLVRKAAAITAGRLRLAAAHDTLVRLVTGTAPAAADAANVDRSLYTLQARMAQIFALHRLGDTRYSHELEQAAIDPRPQVRGDTALLLGLIGNTSAEPILFQMMKKDRASNVRLQAAEALWRLGDARGEDTLVQGTVSSYASDRMIALTALAEPHNRAVLRNVYGLLTDEYPEVALVAARAAGELGNDAGIGVAEAGARSTDPMQRALAALALGAIGRADSQPILAKLLGDDQPDVRLTAATAILQIDAAGH